MINQLITHLAALGEFEAIEQLKLEATNNSSYDDNTSDELTLGGLFIWSESVMGYHYWAGIQSKMLDAGFINGHENGTYHYRMYFDDKPTDLKIEFEELYSIPSKGHYFDMNEDGTYKDQKVQHCYEYWNSMEVEEKHMKIWNLWEFRREYPQSQEKFINQSINSSVQEC